MRKRRWDFVTQIEMLIGLMVLCLVSGGCGSERAETESRPAQVDAAGQYEGTIVAMGDSLTAGLGVREERAYPAKLEQKLSAAGHKFRVVNAGVSGETSSGALSRIEWVLGSLQPDILILETGANDGLRGIDPAVLRANLDRLLTILAQSEVIVVLAGMQMLPNLGPDYIQAFNDIYPAMARKHAVVFMPFFLEGVAGDPRLNQDDRLHPTAEGYGRIVEKLYPHVVRAIEIYRGRP